MQTQTHNPPVVSSWNRVMLVSLLSLKIIYSQREKAWEQVIQNRTPALGNVTMTVMSSTVTEPVKVWEHITHYT